MREAQHRFQHVEQRTPRAALFGFVSLTELHFGKLDVPVAIFAPNKFVDRFGREVEAIGTERFSHAGFSILQATHDPAVHDR